MHDAIAYRILSEVVLFTTWVRHCIVEYWLSITVALISLYQVCNNDTNFDNCMHVIYKLAWCCIDTCDFLCHTMVNVMIAKSIIKPMHNVMTTAMITESDVFPVGSRGKQETELVNTYWVQCYGCLHNIIYLDLKVLVFVYQLHVQLHKQYAL